MSLPRFRIRTLMIAVAIVGVLMGGTLWIAKMRALSLAYRYQSIDFACMTVGIGKFGVAKDGGLVNQYDDENSYLRHAWARGLAEKYWQLSVRPWLPVEQDPPPPEPLAKPRRAVDCPAELRNRGPSIRSYERLVSPWWTYPWTSGHPRMGPFRNRWSFP